MSDCGEVENKNCINHNLLDERIRVHAKHIDTLFNYQRMMVPSKLFWIAMAIIISVLSWVTLSLWSMKAEVNQMNLQTIQTLNEVKVQQAIIQNDLKYIADQVKRSGTIKMEGY